MKHFIRLFIASIIVLISLNSCSNDDNSLEVPKEIEVQNFIWKGLNLYYLWQKDSPDLSDDRFETQEQLNSFLYNYSDPKALFDHLRVANSVDRFSVLVDDYVYLENLFQGVTKNNGMDFTLRYKPGSQTELYGVVNYVIPNSDAFQKNITRGTIFLCYRWSIFEC